MSLWLKQSTSVIVQFGPFLDKTDGVTLETLLATAMDNATTGIRLSKNGATLADRSDATVPVYDAMGCYRITLGATDTNTLGTLRLIFEEAATCLPVWQDFMVVPANVWDSLFGADNLQVDLTQIGGAAVSTTTAQLGVNTVQAGGTAWGSGAITAASIAANAIAATKIATGAITSAKFASGAIDAAAFAQAAADKVWSSTTRTLSAFSTGLAVSVWNVLASAVATASTIGLQLKTNVDATVSSRHAAGAAVSSVTGSVGSVVGHTAQTGDSFALANGADGFAATKADTAAILVDTGTTLDTKINDIQGATFSSATDSLEAIRDRGDAAWTTGAGGSDRFLMVDTTIATLATQTSFTLTAGSADDDAYNNCTIVVEDVTTSTQKAVGMVLDYTGSTKTVTLKEALAFTIATTDKVYILAENALKSTVANRQVDVTATGAAGIDWGNVENPTTTVDLSATDIQLCDTVTTNTDMRGTDGAALASVVTEARLAELDAANLPADIDAILLDTGITIPGSFTALQADTDDIQTRLPAALVGGRMDADVGAISTSTAAADALELSTEAIVAGTAQTGTLSTTAMTTNLTISAASQYNGRIIIFQSDTITAALRNQATDITSTTVANGELGFTALTTAPVNGDNFIIV